jgi:hypothetical protein
MQITKVDEMAAEGTLFFTASASQTSKARRARRST